MTSSYHRLKILHNTAIWNNHQPSGTPRDISNTVFSFRG